MFDWFFNLEHSINMIKFKGAPKKKQPPPPKPKKGKGKRK